MSGSSVKCRDIISKHTAASLPNSYQLTIRDKKNPMSFDAIYADYTVEAASSNKLRISQCACLSSWLAIKSSVNRAN
jgi:hypothetical protein